MCVILPCIFVPVTVIHKTVRDVSLHGSASRCAEWLKDKLLYVDNNQKPVIIAVLKRINSSVTLPSGWSALCRLHTAQHWGCILNPL